MYVASTLPVEQFGKFSLLVATFEILFIAVSFNIQATTRIDYFKLDTEELYRRKSYHILFSFIVTVIAGVGGLFQSMLTLTEVTVLAASAFSRTIVAFTLAVLQCKEQVNRYIIIHQSFTLTLALGTIYFVGTGMGIAGWFLAVSIASALQLLVAVYYLPTRFKLSQLLDTGSFDEWVSVIRDAALFMPQAIGWWLKSSADRFIIASVIGLDSLGVYSLAYQLSSTIIVCITAINLAIVPSINRALLRQKYQYVRKMYGASLLFVIVAVVIVYILGNFTITYFFDAQYQSGRVFLPWLCAAMLPQALTLVLINELYFCDSASYVAKLIVVLNTSQTLVNLFVVEKLGILAMILVSLLANLTMLSLVIGKIRKVRRSHIATS